MVDSPCTSYRSQWIHLLGYVLLAAPATTYYLAFQALLSSFLTFDSGRATTLGFCVTTAFSLRDRGTWCPCRENRHHLAGIMEPLSVAASAITVATLAASTCRAFSNLRSLCKSLPGRLHALNNEVADIEVVLIQVATIFHERACSIPDNKQQIIPRLLEQASDKLDELRIAIERLTRLCDRTKIFVVQAHAWRKEQPKLRTLQHDIKTVKCSLNIVLGASNSYAAPSDSLSEKI